MKEILFCLWFIFLDLENFPVKLTFLIELENCRYYLNIVKTLTFEKKKQKL